VLKHSNPLPFWVFASLLANGVLFALLALMPRLPNLPDRLNVTFAEASPEVPASAKLGPRHQLTYEQWVALLGQEAKVAAEQKPKHLAILVGDSLSLWFPVDLLPLGQSWLNQGISGETSFGLLKRLSLFDATRPEIILVMIGINDLIRGVSDEALLENQQQIVQYLRVAHPRAKIVVQSILPHEGSRASWQGRDRLATLSNDRIRKLNRQLAEIADQEGVYFLDLHPLFTDSEGNLRADLSSDGLHLSSQGYLVWRSALQLYQQLELQEPEPVGSKAQS
jgi:lysophospholipase L1-like esterase